MMVREHTNIRYRIIELLSYWQGLVNTTQLIQHFSVSRTQAQKYFKSYQADYPDNLIYDNSLKGFRPSETFTSNCISSDVNEYLDWLNNNGELGAPMHNARFTNATLSLPVRKVLPQVMRGLISAIKHQKRLEVNYVSLANPNGEGRIIQPHIFVKTGLRWHLRAYDEKHQQFRDFVLSRFRGQPEILDNATHNAALDIAWNSSIEMIFSPDSRLSPEQKNVIEQDYQMQDGKLVTSTRAALAQYLLQDMQVNIKFHDAIPEAQQLILVNLNDIKQWLFNA
ncbi:MAG: putative DNA-binding transcriptional regulator YafY [Paraglaciecola sp.]